MEKQKEIVPSQQADNQAKEKKKPINIVSKIPSAGYKPMPQKLNDQYKLADEFLTWAYESDACDLDVFPVSKRYSPYRFYALAKHNPYFAESLEVAQYVVSVRLKAGWRTRDMDASYVKEMLPEYNQTYRDWVTAKITALIQARDQHKQGPTVINVIKSPVNSCPEVPERVQDDNKFRDPDTIE